MANFLCNCTYASYGQQGQLSAVLTQPYKRLNKVDDRFATVQVVNCETVSQIAWQALYIVSKREEIEADWIGRAAVDNPLLFRAN